MFLALIIVCLFNHCLIIVACILLSWFNRNPLLAYQLQGLWNHVPCVYDAALHTQQQAAGMLFLMVLKWGLICIHTHTHTDTHARITNAFFTFLQLLRKRHIGNDIVTIVFQEPGALPFTPKNIRSHFQHVFVIVRAHNPCSDTCSYRWDINILEGKLSLLLVCLHWINAEFLPWTTQTYLRSQEMMAENAKL